MAFDTCGICAREDMEDLEQFCLENAQEFGGELSWRKTAEELGLSHANSLTNHMRRHFVAPSVSVERALEGEWERQVQTLEAELYEAANHAPPEVRPLYLVAIRNLRGLLETKPSQQNLTQALKAIHEITGMKMEQKLMLEYAKTRFGGELPAAQPNELEVLDAESWEVARA
jgi:hypothetical protein